MFTITPEVASFGVFPPRQRLVSDDDDDYDDETTYGCLPSRQRSRAYEYLHRARGSRVMMMIMMRRLTDVYHHTRGRELRGVSTAPEARSMYDVR